MTLAWEMEKWRVSLQNKRVIVAQEYRQVDQTWEEP